MVESLALKFTITFLILGVGVCTYGIVSPADMSKKLENFLGWIYIISLMGVFVSLLAASLLAAIWGF